MNDPLASAEALLSRAIDALPDYRQDLILVGGLVPWLYRRLPGMNVPEYPAIATSEADISIKRPLPLLGRAAIVESLRQARFAIYEVPSLDPRQRGQQRFQDEATGVETAASVFIEFLSPLRGKPVTGLVEPQPGLRTPALRYLDLLAHAPIDVELRTGVKVRVPHPAMYLVQKVLSRRSGRAGTKRPKDMAYIYDVALVTRAEWSTYSAVIATARDESEEWASWLTTAAKDLDTLFKSEFADGAVEAATVLRGVTRTPPSSQAISKVVQAFRQHAWPRAQSSVL